jgi:uncharacterized protein (DUF885 family)
VVLTLAWTLSTWLACAPKPPLPTPAPAATARPDPATTGVENEDLKNILADHWSESLAAGPLWATGVGDRRYDDRLGDPSRAADARWEATLAGLQARAEALDPAALGPADQLTRELFLAQLDAELAAAPCRFGDWRVSPRHNALAFVYGLPVTHTVNKARDATTLLARYRAVPGYVEALGQRLRAGADEGWSAPAESVRRTLAQFDRALADTSESPLLEPLDAELPDMEPAARAAWEAELRAVVSDEILPALRAHQALLRDHILPRARPAEQAGVSHLPSGAACYAGLVRRYTTLDRSPDEVHAAGLAAIDRVHEEFRALGATTLGTDQLPEIFDRLRSDPALRFETAEEIEQTARRAVAAATAAVPAAFGRLPEAPCEVERIPDHEAPFTTIAYYMQAVPPTADDPGRPGTYFVNTHAPETRPRFEAEALAWHEAVPGHHLQIALSRELPEMPGFRRFGGTTAFVEGWALYTERLADELGLYSGDLDRLGMLSFDAWRAARLVVDTGIHHKGWTRAQAEAYMRENTPLALNNIENEVDRYVGWPGQAVAYKTGQLEILRIRREAEAALGERFVLADFHDVVLGAGSIPLPVLERRVRAWVAAQAQ